MIGSEGRGRGGGAVGGRRVNIVREGRSSGRVSESQ
jgi:hypothetical protein